MAEDAEQPATTLGGLLRRIRRTADCSQRELAERLGLSATAVAQAETGVRDLPATALVRAAGLAGLRLALLGADGEVPGMVGNAVRDRSGRRFPAHLDTRHGDEDWWHGPERYTRSPPRYTFDRDRGLRDQHRAARGTPPDHQQPRPGDSLAERAQARRDAVTARRHAAAQEHAAEQRRLGFPDVWSPPCTCPPACDDLLFADELPSVWLRAQPHVDGCPCGCDIA